jgi:signal transduction histidine kinase
VRTQGWIAPDEYARAGAWAEQTVADGCDLELTLMSYFTGGHTNAVGKAQGTGIRLAGACIIVQQHGGRIDVRNEDNTGTTFILRLPLKTALRP